MAIDPPQAGLDAAHDRRPAFRWPGPGPAIAIAGLLVVWGGFLWRLRLNWSGESYYSYGLWVPLLAGVLAWQRWRGEEAAGRSARAGPGWTLVAAAVAVIAFVPFLLAIDLNPFWRLPLWGAGIGLIAASWLALVRFTGWRRAASQSFPLLFLLTTIPWPMAVERGAIQSLTQFVVGANTVVLQSSGYAAQADGNVITIGACEVGVEEACSGIRSLQSTGMLALFVGAFWQLSWLRRATLLVIAAGAAFGFNLARALALSLIVFHGGEEPYARWHDTVGYVALFACIGTLFAVAWWLSRSAAGSVRETTTPAPALLSASTGGRRNAAAMACAFGVVCVAPEAFAAWWYRSATENEPRRDIAVSWPIDSGYEVTSLEIDPRIRDILEFDHGERVIVRGTDAIADAWFYRFDADASGRSIAAYVHSPTVCMTAGGARLVATRDRLDVDLGPFSLPFEHYTFRASARNGGGEIEVFWCMWDGGLEIADPNGGFRHAFVSAILGRRRDVGRKVLLVAVHARGGVDSRRELTRLARASVTPLVDGEPVRLR